METKQCIRCKGEFPLSQFHKDAARPDKLCPYCKKCVSGMYHKRPIRTKEFCRRHHLKEKYGITPEQYGEMVAEQKGVCAICGQPEKRSIKGCVPCLGIDHNHETGQMRGLLCYACNLALGYICEDPETLKKMIVYLERYKDLKKRGRENNE